MKRIITECMFIIGIFVSIAIQTSLIADYPIAASIIQLNLFLIILFVIFRHIFRGIIMAIITGYYMDLHSALPFGIFLFAFFCSITLLLFFQNNIFKNRALHAIILNTSSATLIYYSVIAISLLIVQHLYPERLPPIQWVHYSALTVVQIISHSILIVLCFIVITIFGQKYHKVYTAME
ncbi:MAG TPA: hypothetical protein VJB65_01385 [Patescibacteria group bacterium]|nr:hypothetical protein [Patescibacteria group bacterium]